MDLIQALTLVIASIGCVLGVLNTWKTYDKERVKLIVRPAHIIPVGAAAAMYPNARFSIEVINRSSFPVTVTEVGFLHRGLSSRAAVVMPIVIDGKGGFPRKIEAREAVSFYTEKPGPRDGKPLTCAYARTADGRTFKGNSPALRQLNG